MAEPNIKPKLPPTLIIGLGGTGCDIVSRVDKLSNEEQRKYIRFVYFDTDANELRVRKEEAPHVFTVQTSRKMTVGQALRTDREARENSFPTSYQLLKKPLTEGAGQVRAVSKLAFDACLRDGRITPLHDAINELQHLNGDTLEQSMRVVIVSTLVGGTGSGIVLPVSMYVRNYLENVCQKKPLIRGICVLPDVFFRGNNKTEVEKNNLRANAYAALRELDAFMMKSDTSNKNSALNKYWLKMPTPGTVDDYDEYTVNPMDFCFLYDGLNMDGDGLRNFEAYKQHVADCVYASSISKLNKRLNSSEDNTILSRCEEGGRNRYCGVGSSKIVYPFDQVRDYIAMNWMSQAMTDDWLRYDKEYEKKVQQQHASRKKGVMLPPIDKRAYYCKLVDSDHSQGNYFASEIFNQCYVNDPDGLGQQEAKWISYYRNICTYISDRIQESAGYDKGCEANISRIINALNEGKSQKKDGVIHENFPKLALELKKYFSLTKKQAEGIADIAADSLFSIANYDTKNPTHLEYWLTNEGSMVHPNAARYFLYQLEMFFKEAYGRLMSTGKIQQMLPNDKGVYGQRMSFATLENSIRSFFEQKIYDRPTTGNGESGETERVGIEEYVRCLDVKTLFDSGNTPKSEWISAIESVIDSCSNHKNNIKQYYQTYLEVAIIKKAIEHIGRICGNYEFFYQQIDSEIQRLPRRIARIEEAYVNNIGDPVIYACASEKCLKGMLERCPNIVDPITLTEDFRDSLFNSIYKTFDIDDENKRRAKINDFVNEGIIAFWREQVVAQYGKKVDMDVIDALCAQAEIEESKLDADEQVYYIKAKKDEAMKLASPFIDRPIGVEPYIIDACSLGIEVTETNDRQKAEIIKNIFTGHESDPLMDKYQMLFMKALYNIRVSDLPKFAPADECEVDPHENGSYYRAYWKRINGVIPDDKQTKILTPHLDKRWHYIGVMPDLSEKSELLCLNDARSALFISIAYGRFDYDRDQYRFKDKDGDYISDNIIVGDGKCNNFSEIYEAMLMSRPLVLNLLDYYKDQIEEEKSESVMGRSDYKSTRLYKNISKMELIPYSRNYLSIFELPLLYKATVGSGSRRDDEAIAMFRHELDFIEDYLSKFYGDKLDRTSYFVQWVHEQMELMYTNLRNGNTGDKAHPLSEKDPLVKRMKDIVVSKIQKYEFSCKQDDTCVKDFLDACEKNFLQGEAK